MMTSTSLETIRSQPIDISAAHMSASYSAANAPIGYSMRFRIAKPTLRADHQGRRRLTRLFRAPFFSILPNVISPISPVRLTWVPPQGCRST